MRSTGRGWWPVGGVAMSWFARGDRKIQCGLRSQKGVDVAQAAAKLGGGGHKDASGFILDKPAAWFLSKS